MTISEIIKENEELQLQYSRALETIAKLENRLAKLQKENTALKQQVEELKKDRDELRRIMKHYKKKYMQLRRIIARAIAISEEMGRELTVNDLRRLLTGELTKRR